MIFRGLSIFRRFGRAEEGSVTIEFVLWVPMMVGLLCLCADGTLLMHTKSILYEAARDASRQVALGQATPEEAESRISARFQGNAAYEAEVETQDGFVTTTVSVPFSEVASFTKQLTGDSRLAGSITMWIETNEDTGG